MRSGQIAEETAGFPPIIGRVHAATPVRGAEDAVPFPRRTRPEFPVAVTDDEVVMVSCSLEWA